MLLILRSLAGPARSLMLTQTSHPNGCE